MHSFTFNCCESSGIVKGSSPFSSGTASDDHNTVRQNRVSNLTDSYSSLCDSCKCLIKCPCELGQAAELNRRVRIRRTAQPLQQHRHLNARTTLLLHIEKEHVSNVIFAETHSSGACPDKPGMLNGRSKRPAPAAGCLPTGPTEPPAAPSRPPGNR